MGLIPPEVIDQVLMAHDVVEVVGRYVQLKNAGRSYKALCPFHDEKTPSFTVNPDRQTFKCFGCGKGGNIFRFLMEHEGMTFPEAVRSLARERGIDVPEVGGRSKEEEGRYDRAMRAIAFAQAAFQKALAADMGQEARAYLEKRGYDPEAQRRFGLGYAPLGWDRLLEAARRRAIPPEALEDSGLVVRKDDGGFYDRFRHRVIFPIADLQGRVVTFGARALGPDDVPKYLNGPETVVFKKANTLYALDRAKEAIRRTGEALLLEGYTDVLMCHLHGFDRAVAGMGTAFTGQQARLLKRFAQRVILIYDADEAGQTAAERTLDVLLPEGLEIRMALLPAGRDIDEILLEEGTEAVERLLSEALDVLDFKLHVLGRRLDLQSPDGRARAGEQLVKTLVRVPSAIARDQWILEAAERLGGAGTEAALRSEAAKHVRDEGRRLLRRPAPEGSAPVPPGGPGRGIRDPKGTGDPKGARDPQGIQDRSRHDAEAFLLAGIVFFPELRGRVLRALGPEDFAAPAMRRIYNAVLEIVDQEKEPGIRVLVARLADDEEALEVLAGLPEDDSLEERIPLHIEYIEQRRRSRRRTADILRELEGIRNSEAREADSRSEPIDPSPEHAQ